MEDDSRQDWVEEVPDAPTDPVEVASAARSCSVLLMLAAALVLIVCVITAVTIFA